MAKLSNFFAATKNLRRRRADEETVPVAELDSFCPTVSNEILQSQQLMLDYVVNETIFIILSD